MTRALVAAGKAVHIAVDRGEGDLACRSVGEWRDGRLVILRMEFQRLGSNDWKDPPHAR